MCFSWVIAATRVQQQVHEISHRLPKISQIWTKNDWWKNMEKPSFANRQFRFPCQELSQAVRLLTVAWRAVVTLGVAALIVGVRPWILCLVICAATAAGADSLDIVTGRIHGHGESHPKALHWEEIGSTDKKKQCRKLVPIQYAIRWE